MRVRLQRRELKKYFDVVEFPLFVYAIGLYDSDTSVLTRLAEVAICRISSHNDKSSIINIVVMPVCRAWQPNVRGTFLTYPFPVQETRAVSIIIIVGFISSCHCLAVLKCCPLLFVHREGFFEPSKGTTLLLFQLSFRCLRCRARTRATAVMVSRRCATQGAHRTKLRRRAPEMCPGRPARICSSVRSLLQR